MVVTHPGVLAIDLSEVSVQMVGVQLQLLHKAVAISSENMIAQVIH